jgi:LmbE family N-acetylglucosaminyl deacetylase
MMKKSVALVVAHPDDETLWAGGTLLNNPSWECFVVCLCRGNDTDRNPKFFKALKFLNAEGTMGNIDDQPEQIPLNDQLIEDTIQELLPQKQFDLIITHSPNGEYTRHIRHEETGRAVSSLWKSGKISASELWNFAYEDGDKKYYPKAIESSEVFQTLKKNIWLKKYEIITKIYGFSADSWETKTTPLAEAFRKYSDESKNIKRLKNIGAIL